MGKNKSNNIPYETFAEAMPQMAFIADREGEIIFFNQRWYEYVGGVDGTEGWGWKEKNIHHPEDLERTLRKWTNSLKTGKLYEIEYRLRRYDGKYRWHLGRALPLRDETGEIKYWLGTNTDIHNQKKAEEKLKKNEKIRKKEREKLEQTLTKKKLIQKKLSQSNNELMETNEKLGKLNQLHESLLYVIAHDLKNPISNMHLTLQLLKKLKDEKKKKEMMSNFENILNHQEEILNGLMEIIRVQSTENSGEKEIDLKDLVKNIKSGFAPTLNSIGGRLEFEFENDSKIKHIRSFVSSILENLISNAIKYRDENKNLVIKMSGRREADHFLIKVEDNGIGIDLEKWGNYLFRPFKRFTNQGIGSGTGLYIIKNLIEKNGGHVKVESEIGKGTTFYCYFKEYP